ncbi:MAG TPA: hypothetical protein VFL91_08450 [Thermomicrobiales bacterium]|nr:hypothetical protein [Thermomicrobiales bacterium]
MISNDDLAAIRARHVPMGLRCVECSEGWPCDAARLIELLDAAECRLATKGGGTLVVTAAELHRAHAEARAIAERARCWAAGWRRAAYDFRDRADLAFDALEQLERQQARLYDRLDRAAAVVEAARAVLPLFTPDGYLSRRWHAAERDALRDALAALDAATKAKS